MTQSPASAPPAAPASSGSTIRLVILIALLVGVVGMFIYDRQVAEPKSEAAYDNLMTFVADQNAKGVDEAKLVQSADVQSALGMEPTFVETNDEHNYTIEYYCWFGKVPVLNTWKRYLSVVYVGEPRRYDAHYKNQRPPADSLPGYVHPVTAGEGEVPEVDMGAEGAGGPPPDGAEEGGKKKGGKKKKGGDAPAEETPAGDTPAGDAPPATETPATETPATETPASETPATETPAAESPAPEATEPTTPPAETPAEPKAAEPPASEDKPEPEAPAEDKAE
jgi:hypothetical protein